MVHFIEHVDPSRKIFVVCSFRKVDAWCFGRTDFCCQRSMVKKFSSGQQGGEESDFMKLCMVEISTDGLAHIAKPILQQQAAKPSVDLCNDAGAFINEGGVDLH